MDPQQLSLKRGNSIFPKREKVKAPRHKAGERFLCGPIPMVWLHVASQASGQGSGFKVAIALWYLSGLNRKAKTIKLSGKVLRDLGVKRHAGYRGLTALVQAGLVKVDRRNGQCPAVTILEVGEAK